MNDELSKRQAAIGLRLAGEPITLIYCSMQRTERWFHKWWQRYLTLGPEGLYDLTRANQQIVNRTPPHVEHVINLNDPLAATSATILYPEPLAISTYS